MKFRAPGAPTRRTFSCAAEIDYICVHRLSRNNIFRSDIARARAPFTPSSPQQNFCRCFSQKFTARPAGVRGAGRGLKITDSTFCARFAVGAICLQNLIREETAFGKGSRLHSRMFAYTTANLPECFPYGAAHKITNRIPSCRSSGVDSRQHSKNRDYIRRCLRTRVYTCARAFTPPPECLPRRVKSQRRGSRPVISAANYRSSGSWRFTRGELRIYICHRRMGPRVHFLPAARRNAHFEISGSDMKETGSDNLLK